MCNILSRGKYLKCGEKAEKKEFACIIWDEFGIIHIVKNNHGFSEALVQQRGDMAEGICNDRKTGL